MRSVPANSTAYGDRRAPFLFAIDAAWDDSNDNDANLAWSRTFWNEMQAHSSGGLYVNFPGLGEEKEDLVRAAYGVNYERLVGLKTTYDPTNLFRLNQNIVPATQSAGII